jgi:hypothetical protein
MTKGPSATPPPPFGGQLAAEPLIIDEANGHIEDKIASGGAGTVLPDLG